MARFPMKTSWLLTSTCSLLLILLSVPAASAQQPTIIADGVRNGASYALGGMPNAAIAQGSIMVIFGDNLGPTTLVQVATFPLPTAPPGLSGTSVRVTIGGTSVQCIMLYTLKTQVAAVLPSNTPIGTGTLTVTYNGQTSAAGPITVVARSFGIFAVNQGGSGPGILQNVNTSDQPLNSMVQPARPGQLMIAWGTGIGPVSGDEAAQPLP